MMLLFALFPLWRLLHGRPVPAVKLATIRALKANPRMANPQITAGGPPVAVTFTPSSGNVTPNGNGIFAPASGPAPPQQVSSASVNTHKPGGDSATQNGWTLTADANVGTGSVQAPATATPGTGYLVQVGESSGYGYAYFDVMTGGNNPAPPPTRRRSPAIVF